MSDEPPQIFLLDDYRKHPEAPPGEQMPWETEDFSKLYCSFMNAYGDATARTISEFRRYLPDSNVIEYSQEASILAFFNDLFADLSQGLGRAELSEHLDDVFVMVRSNWENWAKTVKDK